MPISVFLSIVIERKYLRWRAGSAGYDGRWNWTSWANVFSAVALVGVLMLSSPFNTYHNRFVLLPYRDLLFYLGIAVSVIAFAAAFVVPAMAARRELLRQKGYCLGEIEAE